MEYKQVQQYTKEEAQRAFAHGTGEQAVDALLGVTYYVEDWRWVQSACLALLERSEVRWTAIQCLGHLATFHKTLDFALVLPELRPYLSDPALAPVFYDAFGDMAGVADTTYFEQHWDELPSQIKETLIEAGVFNTPDIVI